MTRGQGRNAHPVPRRSPGIAAIRERQRHSGRLPASAVPDMDWNRVLAKGMMRGSMHLKSSPFVSGVNPVPPAKQTPEIEGTAKDFAQIQEMVGRIIELANQMKDEGKAPPEVNAALMLASGFYASFLAVGNDGQLDPKAMDQISGIYRKNLTTVQKLKQGPAAGRA